MSPLDPAEQAALDAQYNLRAAVPEHPAFFARWAAESEAARRAHAFQADLAYGPAPLERIDYVPAGRAGRPLLVFIHGGYWQSFDKKDFTLIAPAFLAAGVNVALVNYTLAPDAGMDEIVRQNRAAVAWLIAASARLGHDPRRIVVSGHSAGGHLTAMVMAANDAVAGCAISGLYDLEPIRRSYLNRVLGMDAETARRNSPIHGLPRPPGRLLLALGAGETRAFHEQQEGFARRCAAARLAVDTMVLPGEHHFSMIDRLADGNSALFGAVLERLNA